MRGVRFFDAADGEDLGNVVVRLDSCKWQVEKEMDKGRCLLCLQRLEEGCRNESY